MDINQRLSDLGNQITALRRLFQRGTTSGAPIDTRPVIAAWDDAIPRQYIGTGEAIAEGTGITLTRIGRTGLIEISSAEGGVTAHSALSGLTTGDDHTHYVLESLHANPSYDAGHHAAVTLGTGAPQLTLLGQVLTLAEVPYEFYISFGSTLESV